MLRTTVVLREDANGRRYIEASIISSHTPLTSWGSGGVIGLLLRPASAPPSFLDLHGIPLALWQMVILWRKKL